jgi:hypothetical protein
MPREDPALAEAEWELNNKVCAGAADSVSPPHRPMFADLFTGPYDTGQNKGRNKGQLLGGPHQCSQVAPYPRRACRLLGQGEALRLQSRLQGVNAPVA